MSRCVSVSVCVCTSRAQRCSPHSSSASASVSRGYTAPAAALCETCVTPVRSTTRSAGRGTPEIQQREALRITQYRNTDQIIRNITSHEPLKPFMINVHENIQNPKQPSHSRSIYRNTSHDVRNPKNNAQIYITRVKVRDSVHSLTVMNYQ